MSLNSFRTEQLVRKPVSWAAPPVNSFQLIKHGSLIVFCFDYVHLALSSGMKMIKLIYISVEWWSTADEAARPSLDDEIFNMFSQQQQLVDCNFARLRCGTRVTGPPFPCFHLLDSATRLKMNPVVSELLLNASSRDGNLTLQMSLGLLATSFD